MAKFIKKHLKYSQKNIRCPLCEAIVVDINYTYFENGRHSDFFSCGDCSFIFAVPELIENINDRQMDSIDDAELFNSQFLKKLHTQLFLKKEIRKIKKHSIINQTKLLDVGCGSGWTSNVYSKSGFDVTGLEPSIIRADIAKNKYKLKIINNYIENITNTEKFNFVVLRHFIEHISSPKAIIRRVNTFLLKDGIVIIVVPNINCLGRYLFETDWTWVHPWHCSFFSPKSARVILEQSGFKVLECYQTPSPLYFMESFLRKLSSKRLTIFFQKNPFLSKIISTFFSVIGTASGLGDNITIIARKVD